MARRGTIEEEVERRLKDALRSAGVGEGRVALEVLYHLPKDFVRDYEELYFAIHGDESRGGIGGRGKVDGRALGRDEKQAKIDAARMRRNSEPDRGDGRRRGDQGLRTRHGYGVGSGGAPRYREDRDGDTARLLDEQALEIKRRVDKELKRIVGRISREVQGQAKSGEQSQGDTPGWKKLLANGREACRGCGKLVGRDWVRCPTCID
jgi:hypothetical protein